MRCFPQVPATFCATVPLVRTSLLGRGPLWREVEAGTSGDIREVRAAVMRRPSTRTVVLLAVVVVRTSRR
jgi:hypothetical protein